jgi:hypothetical protein
MGTIRTSFTAKAVPRWTKHPNIPYLQRGNLHFLGSLTPRVFRTSRTTTPQPPPNNSPLNCNRWTGFSNSPKLLQRTKFRGYPSQRRRCLESAQPQDALILSTEMPMERLENTVVRPTNRKKLPQDCWSFLITPHCVLQVGRERLSFMPKGREIWEQRILWTLQDSHEEHRSRSRACAGGQRRTQPQCVMSFRGKVK